MAWYIEPPKGNISLQKLGAFAEKRLDFLEKIYEAKGDVCQLHELVCAEETVSGSDCLIVGSAKDKVSHFILRLLLGGDQETQDFFCKAETALFDFHFSCMTKREMSACFHKINRELRASQPLSVDSTRPDTDTRDRINNREIEKVWSVFRSIKNSVTSWNSVVELYMAQCIVSHFSVPFQSVLELVSKRQVALRQGQALVPFSKLREVVRQQFMSLMQLATRQAALQLQAAVADERLRVLWKKLKHKHQRKHQGFPEGKLVPGLSLDQVDVMASKYPLCMSSLLRSLRHKHRLGHHARVQLTLFLKEVGLPVHQNMALWQQEYSQASAGSARSWQKDGGRYTYSVRHLYGLEGARRNYRAHCCHSLQHRVLGCNEGGGCPFSLWDGATMTAELSALGLPAADMNNILCLQAAGNFSDACRRHLHSSEFKRKGTPCTDLEEIHVELSKMNKADTVERVGVRNEKASLENVGIKCRHKQKEPGIVQGLAAFCSASNLLPMETSHTLVKSSPSLGHSNPSFVHHGFHRLGEKVHIAAAFGKAHTSNACLSQIREAGKKACASNNRVNMSVESFVLDDSAHGLHSFVKLAEQQTPQVVTDQLGVVNTSDLTYDAKHSEFNRKEVSAVLSSPKDVPTEASLQVSATAAKDGQRREAALRCIDHDVCPAGGACHSFSKPSPDLHITTPAQYFRLTYQRLLDNLKS